MPKLSILTRSSSLLLGGRHGLRSRQLRLPHLQVKIATACQNLSSISSRSFPQQPTTAELWSSPSPTVLFSTGERRAQAELDDSGENGDHKPPDERIVKLGKTLRLLSPLLPNILIHPLPQEILSPNISLHLFPSTHPHLPTVKGRVPYRAALWTAPVAWGTVPIVGDVKLQVTSERMARGGNTMEFDSDDTYGDEKLVVRWKTEGKYSDSGARAGGKLHSGSGNTQAPTPSSINPTGNGSPTSAPSATNGTNRGLSALLGGDSPIFKLGKEEQFSGLFIFSFDGEGKISSHTIEHADEINGWDRTARVVTLTDWLLGKAGWGPKDPSLAPGLACEGHQEYRESCSDEVCPDGVEGRLDGSS